MFNHGNRGRRAGDGSGITGLSTAYNEARSPQITITGYQIVGSDDKGIDTAGGQTILVTGGGFSSGITGTIGGVAIGAITFISATQVSFTSPAKSGGLYVLVLTNTNGNTGALVPGIVYSSVPSFTTAAGSVGTVYETAAYTKTVAATSDSTVTYALTSGSFPPDATFNTSTGVLTGTVPTISSGSTTYNFTITATDGELQDVTRSFSITESTDVLSWVTPSNGATVNLDNTPYSQALSATAGSGSAVTYTADSLPTGLTLSSGTISGTPSVDGTSVTVLTATATSTTRTQTNTITWVISLNDAFFKNTTLLLTANASSQTNSFVSDNSINNAQLTVAGDTRAQSFNPYQPGYYSVYTGGTTSDYITIPTSSGVVDAPGDFTLEMWAYIHTMPTDSNTYGNLFGNNGASSTYLLGLLNTGYSPSAPFYLHLLIAGDGAKIYSDTQIQTNTWYHFAMVRSGSSNRLFINGVIQSQVYTDSTSRTFGSSNSYIAKNTGAYISNFRYVNGVALYTASFTPSTAPLSSVPYTSLLCCNSTSYADAGPRNITLTPTGVTRISSMHPFNTVYQADTQYYGVSFDGSGDYLTTSASSNFDMGTGDFTIECFATTNGYAGSQYGRGLFALYPSGNYNKRMIVRHSSVGNIMAIYGYDGASTYFGSSGTGGTINLINGVWYHIAFVRQSGVFRLYINGVQDIVVSNQTAITLATSNCFDIGRVQEGTVPEWNGNISNFRVIKGTCLYNDGTRFNPPTTLLTAVAGTALLTCQDSTIKDNSSTGATFTSGGQARPVALSPITPTYYSNYFDGAGDYLSVPSSTAFAFGTNNFTIECWFYTSTVTGDRVLVDMWNGGSTRFLLRQSTTSLQGYFYTTTSQSISGGTLAVNTWYHAALVRNGSTFTLYLNGTSVGTPITDSNAIASGTTALTIGGYSGANYHTGFISNVRIVNGVAVYTGAFTVPTSPLSLTQSSGTNISAITAGQTSLLTCQSIFIVDKSSNLFPITVNGDTKVTSAVPFTQPTNYTSTPITTYGSGYFDGTGDNVYVPNNINYSIGSGDFTIECWVYISGTQTITYGYQIAGPNTGQASTGWGLVVNRSYDTKGFGFVCANSWVAYDATYLAVGQWYHLAVVRSGSGTNNFKLYKNGIMVTQATYTTADTYSSGNLYIGSDANAGSYLPGYISDLRIVKGTAVYNANFVPQFTSTLTNIANTQLLTLQSNASHNNSVFKDSSKNNNVINRTGNPTNGSFSPYGDNWSYYFNGTSDTISITTGTVTIGTATDFTVEAWVYVTGLTGAIQVVSGGMINGVGFIITNSLQLQWNKVNIGGGYTSTGTLSLNQWTHISVCRGAGTTRFWINGVLAGSNADATSFSSTSIQLAGSGAAYYFKGYISNFRQVVGTALYTSAFTPTNVPLTAISGTTTLTGQSNRFCDNSVTNGTVTVTSAPTVQKFSPFNSVLVPKSYSAYFSGTVNSITFTGNTSTRVTGGDWTFEAWIYLSSANGDTYPPILKDTAGAVTALYLNGSTNANKNLYCGTALGPTFLTTNAWHHVAGVRSGTQITAYIDGVPGTPSTNDITFAATPTWVIGSDGASRYFNGYISNIRITKGQALYTGTFTPGTSPLTTTTVGTTGANVASSITGTVSFLGCKDNTFIDNSTNNFTLTSTVPVSTFSPFTPATSTTPVSYSPTTFGGSMYFDGTGDYLTSPYSLGYELTTGNFTIEFWMYKLVAGDQYIIHNRPTSSATGWAVMTVSETIRFYFTGGTSVATTATVPLNQWYHIALVNTGGTLKIYFNGTQQFSGSIGTGTISTGTNLFIGCDNGPTFAGFFNGYLSDIRIVRGATLYTNNFYPGSTPLTPLPTIGTTAYSSNLLLSGASSGVVDATRTIDLETVADARVVNGVSPYNGGYYSTYHNGSTDWITYGSTNFGANAFTIEFWVFANTIPSNAMLVCQPTNGAIQIQTAGADIDIGTFGVSATVSTSGGPFVAGKWLHVVAVRSGTGATQTSIFVNGVRYFNGQLTTTYVAGNLQVGGISTQALNGYMSNVRVVNGSAVYDPTSTTLTVPTGPLSTVTNTVLLTCQNNKFVDNSASAFNATVSGTPKVATQNPFQINTGLSYYFDGTGDGLLFPGTYWPSGAGSAFTVEFWIYPMRADAGIFRCNGNASSFAISINASKQIVLANVFASDFMTSTTAVPLNVWTHIAATRTTANLYTIYINGSSAGTPVTYATSLGVQQMYMGYNTYSDVYSYYGYVTDVRVTLGVARTISMPTSPLKNN